MSMITLPAPSAPILARKKLKDIRTAFSSAGISVDSASTYMMRLYRSNLEVRLRNVDEAALTDSQHKVFVSVCEMLKGSCSARTQGRPSDWDEVYKAERMIVLLYSGAPLRQEIGARLHELSAESPAEAESFRRDYEFMLKPAADGAATLDDVSLRMFLLRVMETLHWNAKKKFLARPIFQTAMRNILLGVLAAFCLIIAPYVAVNTIGTDGVGKWWSVFALYTALSSGLMGAFFSRLLDVQRNGSHFSLDQVFQHRAISYTLLRAGVGVCGALIVYIFLRSDFVSGPMFPVFDDVAIRYVAVKGDDAVWMSFVVPS